MSVNVAERSRRKHWDLRMEYSLEEMRLHHPAWYEAIAEQKKLYNPAVFNEYKNSKDELKFKEQPTGAESNKNEFIFPTHTVLELIAAD